MRLPRIADVCAVILTCHSCGCFPLLPFTRVSQRSWTYKFRYFGEKEKRTDGSCNGVSVVLQNRELLWRRSVCSSCKVKARSSRTTVGSVALSNVHANVLWLVNKSYYQGPWNSRNFSHMVFILSAVPNFNISRCIWKYWKLIDFVPSYLFNKWSWEVIFI